MKALAQRVTARWKHASASVTVTGGSRAQYLDEVWEMYKSSYATIGMHLSGKSDLMEYDRWDISLKEGKPIAFSLYKSTAFGFKTGLLGQDGSAEGKSAAKAALRTGFTKSGFYGEVSHAVERISTGAPVVCAVYVPKVLHKTVEGAGDGVHNQRKQESVGMVTKKMVGRPSGIPSGSEDACPIVPKGQSLTPQDDVKTAMKKKARENRLEAAEDAGCQLDFGED